MLKICEENRIGTNINFDKLIVSVATNITDIDSMFWEDNDYDRISLNDLFFENLKSAIGAFENCERVAIIDIIGKAEKTLDISNMFFNCFCLYKLFFLIDCDEYIMNDSFANCVQLDHIVCYENFKNQYLKNEHLNCPKLNEMNCDLYAMTIDNINL